MTGPFAFTDRTRSIVAIGHRLVGFLLIVGALVVLWTQYRDLSLQDLLQHAERWGGVRIATAIGFCILSFVLLGLLEWLGLNWSGVSVRLRTAMIGSAVVNGITHSLGANVVIAALARSWAYRRTGLRLLPSATTTLFAALSFALGLSAMVGLGLAVTGEETLRAAGLAPLGARMTAGVLLCLPVLYIAACARWPLAPLPGGVRLPIWPLALAQAVLGVVDVLLASAILWMLVGEAAPPFPAFVVAYAVACLIGLASLSPGGLGVFEAALLVVLPTTAPEALAAGMIGYRLVFYLLPLLAALALAALSLWADSRAPAAEQPETAP